MLTLVVLDAVAAPSSAVATDSLASFVGVDVPAVSREATKPSGDSKAQRDDTQGKEGNVVVK